MAEWCVLYKFLEANVTLAFYKLVLARPPRLLQEQISWIYASRNNTTYQHSIPEGTAWFIWNSFTLSNISEFQYKKEDLISSVPQGPSPHPVSILVQSMTCVHPETASPYLHLASPTALRYCENKMLGLQHGFVSENLQRWWAWVVVTSRAKSYEN